ncbi:MAG: ribosomal protein S18-alanine N-acetyltransferase [Actinobacteria bacterium]|nr:ribosomal protein S18-alanine N-acetyltransferase [Actinomycetota bacterium]
MIDYRDMNALDVPVVASMERAIYPDAPWSAGQFKEEIAGVPRNRYYIVATNSKSEIVGYAGVFASDVGVAADIHTLTVSPDYRKRGIGRAMLNQLIAWAITRQSTSIFLEMREDNAEANPLYLSAGFVPISRRPDYYGTGLHAVVMKKDLV